MLGTLIGALEARQVKLPSAAIAAIVEGHHELRDGIPVLREVRVHYRLRVPATARETVDRALARHRDKCPTAASLAGAVDVSWTADVEEIPA
jgi:organic hydroperoxide reductase OsmC/OhrA